MTPAAREWGVTLLRLWIGFLILRLGVEGGARAFRSAEGLPSLLGLWSGSAQAMIDHAVIAILAVGGAGILVGIAVRLSALFTAGALAWLIWQAGGLRPEALTLDPVRTTLMVASVSFLLTGPGMLNLGRVFQKKR